MTTYLVDTSWISSSIDPIFWCSYDEITGKYTAGLASGQQSAAFSSYAGWEHVSHIRMDGKQLKMVHKGLQSGKKLEKKKRLDLATKDSAMIKVLKSHLQKCVRRQLSELAVATSAKLLEETGEDGAESLLRRLPIIIIEDATMFPEILPLVWLMAAYNRRGLSRCDVAWILGLVKLVAEFEWWDSVSSEPPPSWQLPAIEDYIGTSSPIVALLIRRLYGGMSCDMVMLRRYIYTWQLRERDEKLSKHPKHLVIRLVQTRANLCPVPPDMGVKRLTAETMLHNCIDHHCSSIQYVLEKKYPLLDKGSNWRELIWYNSSAPNTRARVTLAYEAPFVVWTTEQMEAYDREAKEILAKIASRGACNSLL
jgi:hypothetical protein